MSIRPLADRVVIQRIQAEEKTASGIVLASSAIEKPDLGVVISVGKGKRENGELQPMSVAVGDKVLMGRYSGQLVKVDGVELLVMREDDIFAVLE
ncbi:co-chaperone GroES [Deefgea piscis]|uniref:co-chaperone GroES n=1 Tax=Deefgea piscis TaxID=2739061 RepID=UPI001C826FAD|nr:co-chaperone GroES [Deefgea piscis]QZA80193.1 co-chaperone GroES [Deefgea piscis]